jgi:Flavin reductase like domain
VTAVAGSLRDADARPLRDADARPLRDADAARDDDQTAGERLRQALRLHPAGVAVVTAGLWRRPVGLTVTSFTSVSLRPALVSLLVAPSASVWPTFEQSARMRPPPACPRPRAGYHISRDPGSTGSPHLPSACPTYTVSPFCRTPESGSHALSTSSYRSATMSWSWRGWSRLLTPRAPISLALASGRLRAHRPTGRLRTLTDPRFPAHHHGPATWKLRPVADHGIWAEAPSGWPSSVTAALSLDPRAP